MPSLSFCLSSASAAPTPIRDRGKPRYAEANFFSADFLISDDEVLDAMKACDANFFTVAHALYIPEPFFAFKLYSMVERGYSMKMPVELDNTFLAN